MRVFIIGINGKIGSLLATRLLERGDRVSGLVRRAEDASALKARGVDTYLGDLARMTPNAIATIVRGTEVVVFTAGSNGGERSITKAIDHDALVNTIEAALIANVHRLAVVSVLPESWRERQLKDDEEYYFAVKKEAEVAVSHSSLDWLIVRPSLLTDLPPLGKVALSPAELHGKISRHDVAATLDALLHEPCIRRQILELNEGTISVSAAVAESILNRPGCREGSGPREDDDYASTEEASVRAS